MQNVDINCKKLKLVGGKVNASEVLEEFFHAIANSRSNLSFTVVGPSTPLGISNCTLKCC